jgi:2-phosphosulfolactate phosphatase
MALQQGAADIITGSFPNLSAVCDYLLAQQRPVLLACAAWKDRFNLEDTMFAGAVIHRIKHAFDLNCDASAMAEALYLEAQPDLFSFMKAKNASHYRRLTGFGLDKDMQYCLTADGANVLVHYREGLLVAG